ncbi:hypothetical protein [Spirosoma arcticum]
MKSAFSFLFCYWVFVQFNPAAATPIAGDSIPQKEAAIQVTGEATLTKGSYAWRSLEMSQKQGMPWELSGSLTLITQSGWTVPVRFNGSSETKRSSQPYNQIGISPHFREWLVLHGGYCNVVFSPFTLAGHTFLGVGVELNPGLLRVGAVVGRFNRAANADHADPDRVASFRRRGYSAKIGVGNARNYFDLTLLRVADDVHSIRLDTLHQTAPAENSVLALSGRFQLTKKLFIEVDAAGSAYTHDSRPNTVVTTTNHDERRHLGPLNSLFTARESTQTRTALQASLSYRGKWVDLKLRYKRIEPDYQSMGAYYFQTDRESFTVAPSLKLFNRRLQLRTSIGWQHDNLMNQKKSRTDRLIGSMSASYLSEKNLTFDLNYTNYGITQRAGYRPLNDTVRVAQNNRTLSGSVRKQWTAETEVHTVTGLAAYQELDDLNPFRAHLNRHENWSCTVHYTWQHLPANLSLNVSYGYTLTQRLAMTNAFAGPSLEASKKILTNKLDLRLTASYLKSRSVAAGSTERGSVVSAGLGIDYQVTSVHRLSVHTQNSISRGLQPFREQQGSVHYSVNF